MRKRPTMAVPRLSTVVLCFLSGLATAFGLISFVTHAWAVWTDKISGRSVYIGLWYSVVCDGWSGYCASISHHDDHINNLARNMTDKEPQYALRVGGQVIATLSLFFSIFGAAFTVLTIRSAKNKLQFRLGAVVSLFISGCFLLTVAGNWTGEISAYSRFSKRSNNHYGFPWSLLLAGMGGICSIITGLVQIIMLCFDLKPKFRNQPESYTPVPSQQTSVYTSPEESAPPGNGNDIIKHEYIGLDLRKPELLNNCSDCNVYKENEKCAV